MKFTSLLRASKEKRDYSTSMRLAIVGDSSTQHLATAIKGYAALRDVGLEVYDAGYRQEKALLMDENSALYVFKPDIIFIYWSTEALYRDYLDTDLAFRGTFAENKLQELVSLYEVVSSHKIKILQNSLPEFNDNVYGSFSIKRSDSFGFQIKLFNLSLMREMEQRSNVFPVDLSMLSADIGRRNYLDNKMHIMGDLSISLNELPEVSKRVTDVLLAIAGKIRKCIILDLDNTLWGGVIGDDGMEKIQLGDLGIGRAFVEFQRYLLELKNRGILLAVVSKNDEDVAKRPFLEHPETVLTLDDFVAFCANWESKADNIRTIQQSLNINMDSIVFIDDSIFERNAVKCMIPEIEVPDMPKDPCDYVSFLSSQNYFETISYSSEDSSRTAQYREEANRRAEESAYSSYKEYLKSLEMKAVVGVFDSFRVPRIAQLSQRSNQFNLRTVRMSEADVGALLENDHYITRYFELEDRFGKYGLIGYIVLKKEEKFLFISNWVMSCRVLKRTVEEFIMNDIVYLANEMGYALVVGEYLPSEKNGLVKNLYQDCGFVPDEAGKWILKVDSYNRKESYVMGGMKQ